MIINKGISFQHKFTLNDNKTDCYIKVHFISIFNIIKKTTDKSFNCFKTVLCLSPSILSNLHRETNI